VVGFALGQPKLLANCRDYETIVLHSTKEEGDGQEGRGAARRMEHRSAWECAQRLIGLSHSNSQWNRKGKVGTLGIGVVCQGSPERPPRHSGRSWVGPSDEAQPYGCRRQPSWVLLLGPDATNPFFNTYIFTENDHRRELAAPAAGIVLEGTSLFRTRKAGEAFVANACGGLCVDMLVGGCRGAPRRSIVDSRQ
jgi:hypothetical protein